MLHWASIQSNTIHNMWTADKCFNSVHCYHQPNEVSMCSSCFRYQAMPTWIVTLWYWHLLYHHQPASVCALEGHNGKVEAHYHRWLSVGRRQIDRADCLSCATVLLESKSRTIVRQNLPQKSLKRVNNSEPISISFQECLSPIDSIWL